MKIACQQKKYKLNLNKKGIDNYVKVQFFKLKKGPGQSLENLKKF